MKKLIALLLAFAMIACLFVGCAKTEAPKTEEPKAEEPKAEEPKAEEPKAEEPAAPAEEPAAPAEEPAAPAEPGDVETVELKLWVAENIVDLTAKQVEDFNALMAADGLKIVPTIEPVSESDAATQMVTDVEAGGDIYCFAQDQFARLVQAGALAQVNDAFVEDVTSRNDSGTVAAAKSGDALYAYPLTSDNGYFMYYDKSVIPEADVDSLEALIADCEGAQKYFAFEMNTSAWYLASFFFATGCISEWTTDEDGNFIAFNDTFDSDAGIIACKGMKKLVDSEYHLSSSAGSEFASGAAIVVTGTWDYETVSGLLGDNMGVTDLPSFEVDGTSYHLGSFNGCKLMGVKPQVDSTKALAAHLLANYLTGEKCQMERFENLSWGPSNLVDQASEAVQANPGLAALLKQAPYSIPQGQIHGSWWDIAKVIGDDVKAATDEAGLKEALDNYYNKIDSLFGLSGFIFVGAWNGWSNSDTGMQMQEAGGSYAITVDVPESDYMGGRVVTAGAWDTDKGCTIVTVGADLIQAPDPDSNPDNNIIFLAPGTYSVLYDVAGGCIEIVAVD